MTTIELSQGFTGHNELSPRWVTGASSDSRVLSMRGFFISLETSNHYSD